MKDNNEEALSLLEKYKNGNCTEQELTLLHSWFHELHTIEDDSLNENDLLEAFEAFENEVEIELEKKQNREIQWKKIGLIAASILLFSFTFFYIPFVKKTPLEAQSVVLTLDNGQEINLSDAKAGIVMEDLGITVQKTESGKLQYQFVSSPTDTETKYHTIQTPIGNTFELLLEDGTLIFLNAQSSVRFPSSFNGQQERIIELNGEAYFEVTTILTNKTDTIQKPFRVQTKGQSVQVLGTAFSINAYEDEHITKTTLDHGVVRVYPHNTNTSLVLDQPGQQAIVQDRKILKKQVNPQNEFAWKRGKIIFQDQDINTVMRTISRWYPINVTFKGEETDALFGGVWSKDKTLEEILMMIQETGEVKFNIEPRQKGSNERRVTVIQ